MNRKRRWFQIHLSTAIVLVLFSGMLVYVNFTPKPVYVSFDLSAQWPEVVRDKRFLSEYSRGWPIKMNWGVNGSKTAVLRGNLRVGTPFTADQTAPTPPNGFEGMWSVPALLENLLIAVAVIAFLGTIVEYSVRALERR